METPLVSIIVRTKDRPKLLRQALLSIAAQTYRPIEVVLVNDGGCDLDVEGLKTILGDVSLNYQRLEKNMGRAHAGNVGLENTKGKYVGFLDDDDDFYPEHVLILVGCLEQSDIKVAYTDAFFVYKDYDAETLKIRESGRELAFSQDFDYAKLVFENYIPFMCLLFDKNALAGSGGFDGTFELYEDWDLLIRLGERHPFHHIKKTTACYNQWSAEQQISQRNQDQFFLRQSYLNVLNKHIGRITPARIHNYVSDYARTRYLLKELRSESESRGTQLTEKDAFISELTTSVRERDARIAALVAALGEKDANISGLETALEERDVRISGLETALGERDVRISDLTAAIKERGRRIASVENALREKEAYIELIHSGHGWRLLTRYFKLRDKLLPEGTKRRLLLKLLFKVFAKPREIFKNLDRTNLDKFFFYFRKGDPVTLEKKIEQKLSFHVADAKAGGDETTGQDTAAGVVGKDYFSYLFGMNTVRGEEYVSLSNPNIPETDIKVIAFYLPQFHPIPENDEWWGKGFTEWTNVTRAVPQFIGHYQPRLPGELGFYDLRLPEVQERQIELARRYGLYGFCFHFYWFGGKTLLETPTRQFAENFDFPFCLNWANENWTKRWDGRDNEILIAQKHSPEDDIAFIRHISKYLSNKNYIRIQSRPLLMVYRPALLPDPKATAERWRKWCLDNGIGEIYLAAVRSFDEMDPGSIGFDALIEFPPHALPFKDISHQFEVINANFKGVITDYRGTMEFYVNSVKPPYKKLRGLVPGWDNEARIPGKGKILANSSPSGFKQWFKTLCRFTHDNFEPGERVLFINAWNEWGEGAYLEPDRKYGYAYLQALADALIEYDSEKKHKKIAYVCHDAFLAGAQLLSLNILKTLKLKFHYEVHFLLKAGGELEPEYSKYGVVYNLERDYNSPEEKERLIERLYDLGIREAICNTVASGDIAGLLHERGIKTITLVHELPDIIRRMKIVENAGVLAKSSHKVVFASGFVREKFKAVADMEDGKAVILPQGLYRLNKYRESKDEARKLLREIYSLPENAKIVLGVGVGDIRKGTDLFIEAAKIVNEERNDIYFIWTGKLHYEIEKLISRETGANKNLIFQSALKEVSHLFAGADLYLLTSREDPFPTVVLEAMEVGLPVVGFRDAGGFSDIVNENTGALVPYLDVKTMAREVIRLLDDTDKRKLIEKNTRGLVEEKFGFTDYVYTLLSLLGHEYKKVSVIIPNYNYERYLKARLKSVLEQTYPVYEIIFLDDASTDESIKAAEEFLDEGLNVKLIRNEANSGSVFRQWVRGLQIARGDYIWIAEADDLCDNSFIEELLSRFEKDKDVVLAYCQSKQIDENGRVLAENYFEYTNDINREKWLTDYTREGLEELSDTFAVKNTVPNISAVLFKKVDTSPAEGDLFRFKVAGDWYFYFWLLKQGKIAYVSRSLNFHRRHERGVTKSENKELHFNEVVQMQELVVQNVSVTPEARECALAYRERLIKYFGLHTGV